MHNPQQKEQARHRFRIIDVLALTAILALNFTMSQGDASGFEDKWYEYLLFSPIAITCLIHLRLGLRTAAAMVVHYLVFLAWSLSHSIGYAISFAPYRNDEAVTYQIDWHAYLWREMGEMAILGLIWATAYGFVCYTAIDATFKLTDGQRCLDPHSDG